MSTKLGQIAKKAKLDREVRFTSLAHLLTPAFLKETWRMMNRHAASGVDGQSTEQFASEMEQRVEEIYAQLIEGTYRAPPVRRVEIPKGPGKIGTRPLGIPTVADRLLQRAVARIFEAVFEADFLDCSYGFRPGRNPHHALQALRRTTRRTSSTSCGSGSRSSIWSWPRTRLGCYSLDVLPPSPGASMDRGRRRLSSSALSMSVG